MPWKLFGTKCESNPDNIIDSLTKRKKEFVQETEKLKGMGNNNTYR